MKHFKSEMYYKKEIVVVVVVIKRVILALMWPKLISLVRFEMTVLLVDLALLCKVDLDLLIM